MASKPKTAAEILASAVPAPAPKRRKPRQKNPISYSDQFSVFSVSEDSSTTAFSSSVGENNDEISCVNESNSSFEFVSVITPVLYRELERESRDVEGSTGGYEENYEADITTLPENISSSFKRQTKRISRFERIDEALDILKAGHLSPFDLILAILDDGKYGGYQTEFYKKDNKKLGEFLDLVLSNETGNRKLRKWMEPHALDLACEKVNEEMDNVRSAAERLPGLEAIAPTFIENWSVFGHSERAPFLTRILLTAAETAAAKEKK